MGADADEPAQQELEGLLADRGIHTVRRGLFRRLPSGQPPRGLLPRQQGVECPRHAPPGKGGQSVTAKLAAAAPYPNRIVPGIVRPAVPPAMPDDPTQTAHWTPARQPFTVILARLG